jgi:hypothetical protein
MAGWCFGRRPEDVGDGYWLLGAPFDPWFRQPLWLQTACVGETLWAYNADHLRFLTDLVAADLRTRSIVVADGGPRNRLLESRLPKWMLSRKNRDEVLRRLDALASRLRG